MIDRHPQQQFANHKLETVTIEDRSGKDLKNGPFMIEDQPRQDRKPF